MASRVRWLIACLIVSLMSISVIANTVHPRWMKTYAEALIWGLLGSALFLLATLIAGMAVVANREAPLPGRIVLLLALLLGTGVVWALVETIAVGL